jgi:hypothetical protein
VQRIGGGPSGALRDAQRPARTPPSGGQAMHSGGERAARKRFSGTAAPRLQSRTQPSGPLRRFAAGSPFCAPEQWCRPAELPCRGQYPARGSVPTEPLRLEADPTRLAPVVNNLLHHAAKLSERSGRTWRSGERQGDGAVVRFPDEGAEKRLKGRFARDWGASIITSTSAGEVPEWPIGPVSKGYRRFSRLPSKTRENPRKQGIFALPGVLPKSAETCPSGSKYYRPERPPSAGRGENPTGLQTSPAAQDVLQHQTLSPAPAGSPPTAQGRDRSPKRA